MLLITRIIVTNNVMNYNIGNHKMRGTKTSLETYNLSNIQNSLTTGLLTL